MVNVWGLLAEPILVERMEIYIFLVLFLAAGAVVMLVLDFLLSPRQVWAFRKAKLAKRPLVMVTSQTGVVDFKTPKAHPEGQLELSKNDIKMVPRDSNPIAATSFHIKGTGIPYYETFEGSTVAVNPAMAAAMQVADTPPTERDKLPDSIKEWAKNNEIPIERVEDVTVDVGEGSKKYEVPVKENQKLFTLDIRKITKFFPGALTRSQYDVLLEKREELGRKKAGSQYAKMALPIMGILGVVIIAVIILGGMG